jgi:dethiobiotin synthetase/adenosylmethionine--8-amino-7-oxononanoate aminotransferase
LHQPYYRNHEFLSQYFADRNIPVYTIDAPPEKYGTLEEDKQRLAKWYEEVEGREDGGVAGTVEWLDQEHKQRIKGLDGMAQRTLDNVWWPFTQHGLVSPRASIVIFPNAWQVDKKSDVMVVDSAYGDNFDAHYTRPSSKRTPEESMLKPYFDGSASWFT